MEIKKKENRLSYIDNARSFVIFLVVMVHSVVTYSGFGGWYVIENKPDSLDLLSMFVMGLFNSFNQAWFMGIMFFFGGYFAAKSLSRKGAGKFIHDRLLRLALPLAAYVFIINPLVLYYLAYPELFQPMGSFLHLYFTNYMGKGMFLSGTGPMWFAETLLIFSLVLTLIAKVRSLFPLHESRVVDGSASVRRQPSVAALLSLALLTACCAFSIRVFMPVGTSWLNLQFCYFSSYIVLFTLGVRGSIGGWFTSLTGGRSRPWFWASICIGIPCWAAIMLAGGVVSGNLASINGGLTAQSAAYCLWESFIAIGMSIGLTALFAGKGTNADNEQKMAVSRNDGPGAVSRFFSDNSFSVYVFHPVFLIALTRLFAHWALPPVLKALIVGILAFSVTLAFGGFVVRRIPGVRKYF